MSSSSIPVIPLKRMAEVMPSNVDKHSVEGEQQVRLCNYVDVYKNERITESLDFMAATATDAQIARFTLKADDVIVTKDSEEPTDIGIPAYVPKALPGVICGYHLAVLRPSSKRLLGGYLHWALQSAEVQAYYATAATGISRYALGISDLGMTPIHVPSRSVQESIANFLDEKTARIDSLIAEKERLLARLQEFHRATLWQHVTKGIADAPMHSSGVEWIGECPTHWSVKAIKWLTPVLRGASPRPIDDPKYFDEEGEYGWVRISDVSASDGVLRETEQRLSLLGASLSVKREPGDLFLSIAGTVGKPCIAGIKCCIHDGFVWFPSVSGEALRDWLYAIFESGCAYAGLGKMGTQLNLNTDTVGSIRIPVPPEDEMLKILRSVALTKASNKALQSHVEEHIARLREYRSSLISAAVTGKLQIN